MNNFYLGLFKDQDIFIFSFDFFKEQLFFIYRFDKLMVKIKLNQEYLPVKLFNYELQYLKLENLILTKFFTVHCS